MITEKDNMHMLILDFLKGQTSPEEENQIISWKNASPENEAFFNQLKNSWLLASVIHRSDVGVSSALETIHSRMAIPDVLENDAPVFPIMKYLKIAALLFVVFALGGLTYKLIFTSAQPAPSIVKVLAPKGSRSIAYLPDGTKVWLNAGSEITYNIDQGITRRVTLVGEAFFKVKSDHEHPFIVSANGVAVRAVGTSFNVKAYPEDRKVITTLVEGVVKIERLNNTARNNPIITMKPNQKVIIYQDSSLFLQEKTQIVNNIHQNQERPVSLESKEVNQVIQLTDVNTELYTSWKDPRWIIEGEEFGNLAALLERRYNVKINFNSDDLKKYRFSGTFTNETLEQALSLMQYSLPFSFKVDRDNIQLKMDPILLRRYTQAYMKN